MTLYLGVCISDKEKESRGRSGTRWKDKVLAYQVALLPVKLSQLRIVICTSYSSCRCDQVYDGTSLRKGAFVLAHSSKSEFPTHQKVESLCYLAWCLPPKWHFLLLSTGRMQNWERS